MRYDDIDSSKILAWYDEINADEASEYGLDLEDYDSVEEYKEALEEAQEEEEYGDDDWDNSWRAGGLPRDDSPYSEFDDPEERMILELDDGYLD